MLWPPISRAGPFVMPGREMSGWLHVDLDAAASDDELGRWVEHGVDCARAIGPSQGRL